MASDTFEAYDAIAAKAALIPDQAKELYWEMVGGLSISHGEVNRVSAWIVQAAPLIAAAELERLADVIDRWANIDRGNIAPEPGDPMWEEGEMDDWQPRYIARDEYYSRQGDASLLRSRAKELRSDSSR